MKKKLKKCGQRKNSAKFCPKTQPYAGFSLTKTYKKTPFVEKNLIFLLSKFNFFLENSMHRRQQALSSLQKSVQKNA